ncbi:MAG: TetR/AcrR family transcriptional regulator [Polyangiales bacterium]
MARQDPTRPRGRPPREDLRDHLLTHTLGVLLRDGLEGFSMSSVARSAQASKETLYRHFGDKSGLLAAALEHVGQRVGPLLLEGLEATDTRRARLERLAHNYLGGLLEPASLALQRIAFADQDRGLGARFATCFTDAARDVVTRELAALGAREPALDAELFLGMVRGLHHERALLGVVPRDHRARQKALVAHAVEVFDAHLPAA